MKALVEIKTPSCELVEAVEGNSIEEILRNRISEGFPKWLPITPRTPISVKVLDKGESIKYITELISGDLKGFVQMGTEGKVDKMTLRDLIHKMSTLMEIVGEK